MKSFVQNENEKTRGRLGEGGKGVREDGGEGKRKGIDDAGLRRRSFSNMDFSIWKKVGRWEFCPILHM